jgi:hypothetical protein
MDATASAREAARLGRVAQLKALEKYESGERVTIATHPGAEYTTCKADFVPPKRRCVHVCVLVHGCPSLLVLARVSAEASCSSSRNRLS